MMPNSRGRKAGFGNVRALPSGRFQARYTGPDGRTHKAPFTFDTKGDAETWLSTMRTAIVRETWTPSGRGRPGSLTLSKYAEKWLTGRTLEARTRALYRSLLDRHILPGLGDVPLRRITPEVVRDWYGTTSLHAPTQRAHAYQLLRTILGTAAADELIPSNPVRIARAGTAKRVRKIEPPTSEEVAQIAAAMPERYRALVLLSAFCALRFGEAAALRRSDVDTKRGVLKVRRGVVRVGGKTLEKSPKSSAGVRDVAIPPHLLPIVREHLLQHAGPGRDGLLFPAAGGGHLAGSTLFRVFRPAREAAGRSDLRWHDLRHGGAVMAAQAGATVAELMARLGHSSPGAAMRYQHAARGRDAQIAQALSRMAGSE